MKPFDLDLAKAGHPVCTRDGRRVKILSFHRKNKINKPIISLVEDGEEEIIMFHSNNGAALEDGDELMCDLMMSPEKKEGRMNIYKNNQGGTEGRKLFLKKLFCNHYYNLLKTRKRFINGEPSYTIEEHYCVLCGKRKTVKQE